MDPLLGYDSGMRSVELFAGGGGLLLGSHLAGFQAEAALEWNRWACDTLRQNQAAGHPLIPHDCRIIEGDVREMDWSVIPEGVDLVTGGPPCQPFSGGGLGRAADDKRDMFPATVEVIRTLRPRAFVIENVRGLTRQAFSDYLAYIDLQLQHPEMGPRENEAWGEHYRRLQCEHTTVSSDLQYRLVRRTVNAADYGAPQQRHRVIFVGFRSDLEAEFAFPEPTHSKAALAADQSAAGTYWDRHQVPLREREPIVGTSADAGDTSPWRTVRDALAGMPEPTEKGSSCWLDHRLQAGAKIYPGHTGSPLDQPSKALKAGVHGVPGGENMMRFPDGSVRYYSVREAARIQTFPDRWALHGAWGEAMRQLGNAVPVILAERILGVVAEHLQLAQARQSVDTRTLPLPMELSHEF
ncbi:MULTISPECIES: DNA cytosine methyltransferase [unclassified Micrococcus]|uniref:DNA cytosine methyltransferase n=1 Tax=unclassified Micrococcus TaxID=2620948 RepID=UPI0019310836|nr:MULTISPECIES: DNA cytosine methyltransferase [unclassified Micrococcus]